MSWKLFAGAFVAGLVGAGVAVFFAARKTQSDLSGAGADMQAAFEAAGRLTQVQLQSQANLWAKQIMLADTAQVIATTIATVDDVTAKQYGLTNQFVADATAFANAVTRDQAGALAALRSFA
jgi:hypothetical protein